jgi:hypothetical protein
MHLPLISLIVTLAIALCGLGFFWLFRSAALRRAAYSAKHAKIYRWED